MGIAFKFQCRLIMMVVATMIVLRIMMGVQLHSHARGAVVTSKQMIPPCCPVSLILLWAIFSATGDAELDQEWLLRLKLPRLFASFTLLFRRLSSFLDLKSLEKALVIG